MSTGTQGFGDSGLEFTPDPALAQDDDEHSPGPGRAGRIGAGVASWITAQPWWTEPIAPLPVLLAHARDGEWTVTDWHRTARVWWLHTGHRAVRVLPWLVLRSRAPRQRLAGELPPIAEVRATTGTSRAERGIKTGYVITSGLAQLAMYPVRALAAASLAWLWANWANNVPVLRWLFPDWVTAAYWWPGFVHFLHHILPALGVTTGLIATVLFLTWRARRLREQYQEGASRSVYGMSKEGDTL